jgi:mevalonate kinase
MTVTARARAGGKVILLGEHAVVYGVPALAVGIERGAEVLAKASPEARLELGDQEIRSGDDSELGRALAALLTTLSAPPLSLSVSLELPAGCGLGASAAIGVALARAAAAFCSPEPGESDVLAAAMAWEQVFHGNPSGIDAAASAYGGCIQFTRGVGQSPQSGAAANTNVGQSPQSGAVANTTGIEQVGLGRPLELVLCVAGPPASTRAMVEGVARIKERRPEVFQKTLDGVQALVKNARLCLEAGDLPGLGQLMNLNQMLLSGLHVSSESIERACQVARDAGALGAKLTGAGGGGCIVALADLDPEPVLGALRAAGFECFASTVRARGRT